ncbi:MAG: type II toxin-antitoxin system HicB family antitoxin [Algisphaera sp.]
MRYPIVIHKDPKSCFGVTVPDLPGCFSAGDTLDEAIEQAREAIIFHLEGLAEDGQEPLTPKDAEQHRADDDYANTDADAAYWTLIEVPKQELPG